MKNADFRNVLFLVGASLIVPCLIAEIVMRCLLFIDLPYLNNLTLTQKLRDPFLYADFFSDDDYWKLYYRFGRFKPPQHPHPLLGWGGDFSAGDFIHEDTANINGRRPVLLYGDSFAYGTGNGDGRGRSLKIKSLN